MTAPLNPSVCCETTEVVQVPGVQGDTGAAGTNGTDGVSAFTTLVTASFVVPAKSANTASLAFGNTTWMTVGQNIYIQGAGIFTVVSKADSTHALLTYANYAVNTAAGNTISAGAQASPGGSQPALAAALPTALTDNSTGTQSNTIAAGTGVATVTIPLTSLATGLSTLAIDLLTTYTPGYRFKLLAFDFITTIVGAGAGASQVFNLEIGTTNVTGGILTVTLAGTATIGVLTAGSAITALNVGTVSDTISIEMGAGGTVFTSGSGYFVLKIQNMDSADAVASLSKHVNDLITALT